MLSAEPATGNQPSPAASDARYLKRLDFLFGTSGELPHGPFEGVGSREANARDFVRSRMLQDSFYSNLTEKIFDVLATAKMRGAWIGDLREDKLGDVSYYYLRKPCTKAQLARVKPWWSLGEQVWVCEDSYRPKVKSGSARGAFCEGDGALLSEPECGCGEYLINCAPKAQVAALQAAVYAEAVNTVKYVIQARRPFSEILTLNGSVRSDLGDFYYARDDYFRTGRLVFPLHPSDAPTFRPRSAEFSSGLLTTPLYRFYEMPRTSISMVYQDFLCVPFISTEVRTADVIALTDPRLRAKGHLELASLPGCQSCHARLEYTMRAFEGFSMPLMGARYSKEQAFAGTTRFYVKSEKDLRGEGPATPPWIGQKFSEQPEFTRCMVTKVEQYIYSGLPVPDEVDEGLLREFRRARDFQGLIENTVVAWLLGSVPGQGMQ